MLLLRGYLFVTSCLGAALSVNDNCYGGRCAQHVDAQRIDDLSNTPKFPPTAFSGELKKRTPRKCHKSSTSTTTTTTTTTCSSSASAIGASSYGGSTVYGTTATLTSTTTTPSLMTLTTSATTDTTTTTTESITTTTFTVSPILTTTTSTAPTTTTSTTTTPTTTTPTTTTTTTPMITTPPTTTTTTTSTTTCSSGIGLNAYTATVPAFYISGIVPTLIPAFEAVISVNVDYNGKAVSIGNSLTTAETIQAPDLTFTSEPGYNPDTTTYSYFLIDPDLPNPDAGVARQTYLHWYVSGAKGTCATSAASGSEAVALYQAPSPASLQPHRYTFLVYREPPGYVPDITAPSVRLGFDINSYAHNGGLVLVGGNYFLEAIA